MNIIAKKGDRGSQVRVIQRQLHLVPDGIFGPLTEEAVRDFQRDNGLTVDGIVGLHSWSRLLGGMRLPATRTISEIIIHCSQTPAGRHHTVEDITRWHRQQGWTTIGYHYVVYLDGTVHEGRPVDMVGAHCQGHNTHSIGICYVGGCSRDDLKIHEDTRTPEQRDALLALLRTLRHHYPKAVILGHRDLAARDCPCFNAKKEYSSL